ncbi:tetratricopeptide repeat protein [Hyalangium versicolor]|uniref:tetratricopeptide repeat protein n=1 Tax=Hyalangium versicolor TaxID=2861190 RepID=UPI001CCB3074|nr:tetratricopeptide repeat protein [Hyalangium versicolor]
MGEGGFLRASQLLERGQFTEAFRLFLEAAQAGDSRAQVTVGYLYDTGQGVSQSRTQALLWYRKASHKGVASAATNIATIYRDEGRLRLAVRWFEKAAALGDDEALLDMARLYAGPLEEPAMARKLLSRVLRAKRASEDNREQAERLLQTLEQRQRLSR